MPTNSDRFEDGRAVLLGGRQLGLALMLKEDLPAIARWRQDLEFTALIGAPGEAHSLEMRHEFFDKNARMRSDSVEFAIVLLSNGQLMGLGGLFDISRASTATLFSVSATNEARASARRRRASFANMASSFEISTASKWRSTATIEGRSTSTSVSDSSS